MKHYSIDVRDIVKDYVIGEYHGGGLVKIAGNILTGKRPIIPERRTHRALDHVSLKIEEGEVIGLIGHNGSGKSTLLKILARITDPTAGSGEVRGRVAPLLEVGTGFNPELTGRENVFVNGALLGMSTKEIKQEFDNIVDFSGVEKYIDTPIKRYSSGMKVRLGFAVAAHLKPEIMLVDEVLAVGDAAFQRKSTDKISEVNKSGRTIIFVSHQLELVKRICTRAVRLERGRIVDDGDVDNVIATYFSSMLGSGGHTEDLSNRPRDLGSGSVRFTAAKITQSGDNEEIANIVTCGKPAVLTVEWEKKTPEPVNFVNFEAWIQNLNNQKLAVLSTRHTLQTIKELHGSGRAACQIEDINLIPGRYKVRLIAKENNAGWADCVEDAILFEVVPGDFFGTGQSTHNNALIQYRHSWVTDTSSTPHG